MPKQNTQGLTVSKDQDISEWYTQLIQKAELADYSAVSGCIIYKPASYAVWEKIVAVTDAQFKQVGIKNAYFPLFIPEKLLQKEAVHIAGFEPEVAWVTQAGNSILPERLAVRPTSETIMYDSYSKWIRSYKDLPLRLNQWNNVVRWEFKHATPFLRGREFLWNEGHTCFATRQEALAEQQQIISIYQDVCENYLALPALIGKKSEQEKFAGAVFTVSMEFIMPNGKGIQGPDFHHDGQNFSKAFDISFTDKDGVKKQVWQNTFAISTRVLGVLFAVHSDDKGLVLPPKVAPIQTVIVPILFDNSKTKVMAAVDRLKKKLETKCISVHVDDREDYSPGWKYNEWEMKGVPLRIEIGPRDLAKNMAQIIRRDTGEKISSKLSGIDITVANLLQKIQDSLFCKAKLLLEKRKVVVKTTEEAEAAFKQGNYVYAPWCAVPSCEESFKEKTSGKSLNSPLQQPKISGKCFNCKNKAGQWFYFGRSY